MPADNFGMCPKVDLILFYRVNGSNSCFAKHYTYDSVGNRTKKTENGTAASYTYNGLNQLISESDCLYTEDLKGSTAGPTHEKQAGVFAVK